MTFENDRPTTESDVVLDVRDLEVVYDTPHGEVQAVSDVSFQVHRGEAFALVGESGCGKSTTASAIMRIISKPGRVKSGQVISHDQDLMSMTDDEMAAVRGHRIGMIFQNPLDSLNPVYSLGYQISESLMVDKMEKAEAYKLAESTLRDVRIPDAAERMRQYPHEISGGMRQRVMIGMMLCREPAWPSFSSRTTLASWPTWPTVSVSCTRARSSRSVPCSRSSTSPRTRTRVFL